MRLYADLRDEWSGGAASKGRVFFKFIFRTDLWAKETVKGEDKEPEEWKLWDAEIYEATCGNLYVQKPVDVAVRWSY